DRMRRRDALMLLGGATAWPLSARAQPPRERMRRIGMLSNLASDDPESPPRVAAFAQGLQALGWTVGSNVQIDYRWTAGDPNLARRFGAELVGLPCDIILAAGAITVGPLQEVTRTMPIAFVQVADPVGAGLVASLARPGGNTTGFTLFEYGMSAKWVELLKQIAPKVTRVVVIRDSRNPSSIGQLGALQTAASSLAIEISPIEVRDATQTERAVTEFAHGSGDGM